MGFECFLLIKFARRTGRFLLGLRNSGKLLLLFRQILGTGRSDNGGVLSRQPEKVPKRAAFVAVNAMEGKKIRYRRLPFLGGQRYALACGAQSAPWKTRKRPRRKLAFSFGFVLVFFYPGTRLAT